MAIQDKTLKLCSCNNTMKLDAKALAAALKSGAAIPVHTELCRKQAASFQGAAMAELEFLAVSAAKINQTTLMNQQPRSIRSIGLHRQTPPSSLLHRRN